MARKKNKGNGKLWNLGDCTVVATSESQTKVKKGMRKFVTLVITEIVTYIVLSLGEGHQIQLSTKADPG